MKVVGVLFDVGIHVETQFDPHNSMLDRNYYFFRYQITIKNNSDKILKLLYRKWEILDGNGEFREVEGAGVVGLNPVLSPGESFTYESGCNFATDLGFMEGYYYFQDIETFNNYIVHIPEFRMNVPWKWN